MGACASIAGKGAVAVDEPIQFPAGFNPAAKRNSQSGAENFGLPPSVDPASLPSTVDEAAELLDGAAAAAAAAATAAGAAAAEEVVEEVAAEAEAPAEEEPAAEDDGE